MLSGVHRSRRPPSEPQSAAQLADDGRPHRPDPEERSQAAGPADYAIDPRPLTINLKAAEAIGVKAPASLVDEAQTVIR
jgi:hypothetical protein